MDDSGNELHFVSWCDRSRDSNGYYYVTASWVPYHIHTARCDHSLCAESGFSTSHIMISLGNHPGDRQKNKTKQNKNGTLVCLAHAANGMLYSAVANQRQPQYTSNVVRRRCQTRPTIISIFYGGGGSLLLEPWVFAAAPVSLTLVIPCSFCLRAIQKFAVLVRTGMCVADASDPSAPFAFVLSNVL